MYARGSLIITLLVASMAPAAASQRVAGISLPEVAAFEADRTITIGLDGIATKVPLTDTDVLAPGTLEGVRTLKGELPGGYIRVATDGRALSGVAVTNRGTWWLAERDGAVIAVDDHDAAARIPAGRRMIEPEAAAAQGCDSLGWTPVLSSPRTLVEGTTARTFEVAFAIDPAYVTKYGTSWQTKLSATVNNMDAVLSRDTDISLRAAAVILVPQSVVAATTTETLARLQDHFNLNHGGQVGETVFLFTPTDFTNAAGQVNCVGSAGRTSVSYGVATVLGGDYAYPGGLVLLPDAATKIGMHELAHTLSAHHHYANCVEAATVYNPTHTTDACTVLINDWGLVALRFSSLSRLAMMGWADRYDI